MGFFSPLQSTIKVKRPVKPSQPRDTFPGQGHGAKNRRRLKKMNFARLSFSLQGLPEPACGKSESGFATRLVGLGFLWGRPSGMPQPAAALHRVRRHQRPNYSTWSVTTSPAWEKKPAQIAPTAVVGTDRYAGTPSHWAARLGRGRARLWRWGFVPRDARRELIALKRRPQPFYMVIRRPEWGRLRGLLTPPAQSSQQPLSQVPANRSTCLWSQSGLSGDRAPFPRLIGVRRAKNFTLFFKLFSRQAVNLLFSSFSGFVSQLPFLPPSPGGVKSQQAPLSQDWPFPSSPGCWSKPALRRRWHPLSFPVLARTFPTFCWVR